MLLYLNDNIMKILDELNEHLDSIYSYLNIMMFIDEKIDPIVKEYDYSDAFNRIIDGLNAHIPFILYFKLKNEKLYRFEIDPVDFKL